MNRTCGNCGFFTPLAGHSGTGDSRTGNCLADPPRAFPTVIPPSPLHMTAAPQAAVQGLDPPTRAGRGACRHWRNGKEEQAQ
jgi:hypothetical protein